MPAIPRDSPEPTYRGFRKQALYVLHRLVTDRHVVPRVYHPEGVEDLAVWSPTTLQIEEVVQVKDQAEGLSVSDLYRAFARFWDTRRQHPSAVLKLATFGPVGAELQAAITATGSARSTVAQKLSRQLSERFGITDSEDSVCALLDDVETEPVSETALKTDVIAQLRTMSCGADSERALENLMAFVYRASEASDRLSMRHVRDWLTSVGKFVAARAAFHDEWHSTVIPLEDRSLTAQESDTLAKRFSEGQSAVYEHIVADLDTPRPGIYRRCGSP